jgi:transposase-like protein
VLRRPPRSLYRNYTRERDRTETNVGLSETARNSNASKRSMRKMCQLSTQEKISIVHAVIVNLRSHSDVSFEFNVKPQLVSNLVTRAKRNRKFLEEIQIRDQIIQSKRHAIQETTLEVIRNHGYVWRASQITDRVNSNSGFKVSD